MSIKLIAHKGSVLGKDGRVYKPGMVIPRAALPGNGPKQRQWLESAVRDKFVRITEEEPQSRPVDEFLLDPAGSKQNPALTVNQKDEHHEGVDISSHEGRDPDQVRREVEEATKTGKIQVPVSRILKSGEVDLSKRLWDLDPDGLKGKSLEELNVMVAERDPEIPALDTVEEAVAWLSQDFVEPKAVTELTKTKKRAAK